MPPPSLAELRRFKEELTRGQEADAKALAEGCMRAADHHAQNWDVSESELETFVKGGVFHGFYMWLTTPFVEYSGQTSHFKKFDHDKEGSLGMAELYQAMRAYLQQVRVMHGMYG